MKIINTYICCFENANSHFNEECFKIYELVNGDFIKEQNNGKLCKINANSEFILNLKSNNCLAEYTEKQTPIERLRNKLSPFMTIVELLLEDENIPLPFNENEPNGNFKNQMFSRLLKTCSKYKKDIKNHLSDCEKFYDK